MSAVHLVGSVALDTSDEVFDAIGATVKPYIKRCPDGEVGGRRVWITWQWPLLRAARFLEIAEDRNLPGVGLAPLRLKAGTGLEDIQFGELGYAREARASYQDFLRARERGVLPGFARFQVSLPTPTAVVGAFVVTEDVATVLPAYERAMIAEVARLCGAIPHEDLAIQWDVCFEMLQWDGRLPHMQPPADVAQVFAHRFESLCEAIPPDTEVGFHLCYGDMDGKHGIEPQDLGKAVELANLLTSTAVHTVNWVHMPVPVDRHDAAYFLPLKDLRRPPQTELFLGLVHASDGVEGTLRRMRAASQYTGEFGIATECGMGRARSAETVMQLMRIHAAAAQTFTP